MTPRTYTKTFLPLESNPEIFTSLARNLGLSSSLKFTEIHDLDDEIECEILAYVLAFPTSEGYDEMIEARDIANYQNSIKSKEGDDTNEAADNTGDKILWLRQTIHNACGLYALLHCTCNGHARKYIREDSFLHILLTTPSSQQSSFLSASSSLEAFYSEAANAGDTITPEEGEEVEWHYTAFVPELQRNELIELDGDRWGPVIHAKLDEEGKGFEERAREMMRKEYFGKATGSGREGMFCVLALR